MLWAYNKISIIYFRTLFMWWLYLYLVRLCWYTGCGFVQYCLSNISMYSASQFKKKSCTKFWGCMCDCPFPCRGLVEFDPESWHTMSHTRFLVSKLDCCFNFDNTVKIIRFEMRGIQHNRTSIISFNFVENPSISWLIFFLVFVFILPKNL